MKVYDVSAAIYEGMTVYKNKTEKQPKIEITQDFTSGNVRESRVHLDVHTGTHVDAPLHMMPNGAAIESIMIEDLVGSCIVFDLTYVEDRIKVEHLEALGIQAGDFLFFKTKNSLMEEFDFDFIYLSEEAARYLAEIGVRGVGIDSLGVERSQPNHLTHKALFSKSVIIIEGLRLREVEAGIYYMVAAPLKLTGTDAAPARVLLIEQK
ncbi:cyclase family protein [Terrihalobacillus insolitus]|uniref:cyclase family protein n=1 Tax=Terrihalobacillus insolitus TaxID=2950438 RepID=UPI00233FA44B|nr:cyclase family protein [Terrihalobacillus insolitus]MDC3412955.1 cyclase family protein [Terrihalobacillus insolitus]